MAKTKRKRNNVGGGRLLFSAIILVLAIAIIMVLRNIIALHLEQRELKAQEQDLQNKKDELTAELNNIDDLDYIEEQARKLLRMIKPGEILYVLNGEDPRPEHSNSSDNGTMPTIPAVPKEQTTEDTSEQDYVYQDAEDTQYYYEEDSSEDAYYEDSQETQEDYSGEGSGEYVEQTEEGSSEDSGSYEEGSGDQGE